MWFIRLIIARSGIILSGVILGFAARFLFGPPATDQIDLTKPDRAATEQFIKLTKEYERLLEKEKKVELERQKKERESIGDIPIDASDWDEDN